ncbi:MAG TPA: hypothetical protein VMA73_29530 [Streptosporangiaceae bacterium]|nr:hypothetical protein [Streptosporangiaceae bacterium]
METRPVLGGHGDAVWRRDGLADREACDAALAAIAYLQVDHALPVAQLHQPS